ncbi:MAG: TlpA disulfide reductase family protein [Clostridia bacterium]
MKKTIIIWVLAIALVIVAIVVTSTQPGNKSSSPTTPGNQQTSQLEKATDFTLKDLAGNDVSLHDFIGKPVYVNFFATWCPPCRAEMPDIEKMYQKYKSKGLVVLAVDLKEDNATVQDFVTQNGLTFKVLLDQNDVTKKGYDTTYIPVSVFIDKAGNIVGQRSGGLDAGEMESYLQMLGL